MNLELIMACLTLWFGLKIILKVLKTGSIEKLIEEKQKELEKLKREPQSNAAFLLAYLIAIAIGIFFTYVAVSWFLPFFN